MDGKRAYEYARKGEEVELKSNTITIKEFDVEFCDYPEIPQIEDSKINQAPAYQKGLHIKFRIVCTKGTYISFYCSRFWVAFKFWWPSFSIKENQNWRI